MGQNFLTSETTLREIVRVAGVGPERWVLEIGPGLGALTGFLLEAGAQVVALEMDRGLAAHLQKFFAGQPRATIIQTDALEWDYAGLPEGQGQVVANLPYNVAIPLLFRLLEHGTRFSSLHIMVQKEVADRMRAAPDTEAYGGLTVQLAMLADVSEVLEVPSAAFYPAPNVQSSVVKIVPRAQPPFDPGNPKVFDRLVKAAFGERRKTLRNAVGVLFGRELAGRALEEAQVNPMRRGETLSLEEFCRLSRILGRMEQEPRAVESVEGEAHADSGAAEDSLPEVLA